MELSSSWEAASRSVTQEIPYILWNPKFHLPYLQDPSTGPYPEPDESSPYHTVLFLERPS
jgi:hypothetical protein